MPGLYIGSTSSYAGKSMLTIGLGLTLQQEGHSIGYMKPVGTLPTTVDGKLGDDDALFVQKALGLQRDPDQLTPLVITQDFKGKAFAGKLENLAEEVAHGYEAMASEHPLTLVAGSGSMHAGKHCGIDAVTLIKKLGIKSILIDRFKKEPRYDYLTSIKETLGEHLLGVVLNDVPPQCMEEVNQRWTPMLEQRDIKVLGVLPHNPLMGAITVKELADRLGGKTISAHTKSDRMVESFLIGTMQVENFMTHFHKKKNSAIIMGGDRSDVQLVAMEGGCPCLVLTGNLYPSDVILARAQALETPIIMVREDTYSVARKMESILAHHKLKDTAKIKQGADLVANTLNFQFIKKELGLK